MRKILMALGLAAVILAAWSSPAFGSLQGTSREVARSAGGMPRYSAGDYYVCLYHAPSECLSSNGLGDQLTITDQGYTRYDLALYFGCNIATGTVTANPPCPFDSGSGNNDTFNNDQIWTFSVYNEQTHCLIDGGGPGTGDPLITLASSCQQDPLNSDVFVADSNSSTTPADVVNPQASDGLNTYKDFSEISTHCDSDGCKAWDDAYKTNGDYQVWKFVSAP